MRASICCHTIENARKAYPDIKGCIIHSDRGSQYTSAEYREKLQKYGIIQSMNSRGDRSKNYTMAELKTIIWRYYMSYWANRRICTANAGLPPAVKRKQYYQCACIAAFTSR